MDTSPWAPAEEELLRQLVNQGLNNTEIGERFRAAGVAHSDKAIARKRARLGLRIRVQGSQYEIGAPETAEGDALVLADVHAPFHDGPWINRLMDLAHRWGIGQCVIAGDLWDAATFCAWGHRADLTFKAEVQATKQLLGALAESFAAILVVLGNHEIRLERAAGWQAEFATFAEGWLGSSKVTLSRHHWCFVRSGGETYRVTHPRNASVHATVVPKRLCAKFRSHVIGGHGHMVGMARDDSGQYWAIDSGICADPARLDYAVMEDTTRPVMQQGAVILRGGVPVLLTPANVAFYEGLK